MTLEQAIIFDLATRHNTTFSRRWYYNGEEWLHQLEMLGVMVRRRSYHRALEDLATELRQEGYEIRSGV